ncbi:DICT sensory domain-containing protein [Merismopedia glauca]|uniref:histidine kinase n=1 Tax=Merismopedia glauca CCAP 1448/3 TaxID=1296344 RepID=A0A2T1C7T0_9CYAN|nr:DICT sensory domain-containing protein [Merismopedia glauca]PSB04309.1 histidine kinase [Merismopedia glauca CCAP 1448/3]
MSIPTSILADLLSAIPEIRTQLYFKSSLTALSHAMEDQVLAGSEPPLVIASFQRERFYRQEAHRYRRIADKTRQVYILAAPETEFKNCSQEYETVAFEPEDGLAQEWHLVVISPSYCCGLICREKIVEDKTEAKVTCRQNTPTKVAQPIAAMDTSRRFEGIWTFERPIVSLAAELLLKQILVYRPELSDKVRQAFNLYQIKPEIKPSKVITPRNEGFTNYEAFVQRLVTYLQAGQYKLLKAYRSIADREQKERLVNSITTAIRRSLDPEEILQAAVEQLGIAVAASRCLIYRCQATDRETEIIHEFCATYPKKRGKIPSIQGKIWSFGNNPLFEKVAQTLEPVCVNDAATDELLIDRPDVQSLVEKYKIRSWLMVPVVYKDQLLGIVEIHHCGESEPQWQENEVGLVEAIAAQIAVALLQAQAYTNLENLNQQLEALDRTRSNLVAITGHELRTPLSTIQVCLESLASEPDMSLELRQVMLNTALQDGERMRKLIQDFLTLSRLEGGQVDWHPETLSLKECVELAISGLRARNLETKIPKIIVNLPPKLLVRADGEWLVEVLAKLMDNACKFTTPQGQVIVTAIADDPSMVEVTITDTGRGITPESLETVFDLFYQEEGALRRTTGGTGLGLAICRQIVNNWGGKIWAQSAGKNQGSQFHFTVPLVSSHPSRTLENKLQRSP